MTNLRRFAVLAVIAAGCASPLTVAENRDAGVPSSDGGLQFNPATPKDAALDASDELAFIGDPTDAGPD